MSESPQQPHLTPSGRSQRTFTSDFDSELGLSPGPSSGTKVGLAAPFVTGRNDQRSRGGDAGDEDDGEEGEDEAVHFCLLAEFDIDAGATLADQYPHPTGTDEQ